MRLRRALPLLLFAWFAWTPPTTADAHVLQAQIPVDSWIAPGGGGPHRGLPRDGRWDGVPGDSNYTPNRASRLPHPDDQRVVDLAPGESVPFRNGSPDFSRWAVDDFDVPGLTGRRRGPGPRDADVMAAAIARRYGLVGPSGRHTAAAGRKYMDSIGVVAHHAGGTRVQLVPHGLHGRTRLRPGIPHRGGASQRRNGQ
jgi:hypothetical protein